MNYWWSADQHFYHANILKYCNRPWIQEGDLIPDSEARDGLSWASEEIAKQRAHEMTEDEIKNWNSVVRDGDIVYHCGDFAFVKTTQEVEELISRLKGKIYLYYGNHDHKRTRKAKGFANVCKGELVIVNDVKIWNSHHRFTTEGLQHIQAGAWHCFGHEHGNGRKERFALDVGVDCHNFTPISFEQVAVLMGEHLV